MLQGQGAIGLDLAERKTGVHVFDVRQVQQHIARKLAEEDKALVVVTTPTLRRDLASLVRQAVPDGLVLTYKEVPESKRINVVAVIGASE